MQDFILLHRHQSNLFHMHRTPEFIIPRSVTPRLSPQALLQPKKFAFPLIIQKPRKSQRLIEEPSKILDLLKKLDKTSRNFQQETSPSNSHQQKKISPLRISIDTKREKIQDRYTFSFRKPRLSSVSPKLSSLVCESRRKRVKTTTQEARLFVMNNETITFYGKKNR